CQLFCSLVLELLSGVFIIRNKAQPLQQAIFNQHLFDAVSWDNLECHYIVSQIAVYIQKCFKFVLF
ncbi:hypothetical protein ACJX0J_010402, partial [Zea mays]